MLACFIIRRRLSPFARRRRPPAHPPSRSLCPSRQRGAETYNASQQRSPRHVAAVAATPQPAATAVAAPRAFVVTFVDV